MDKDTVIAEHKEDVRRNRMARSNIWKWSTLVLAIILLISWYANGLPHFTGDQGQDTVAEKAVSFINENLLAGIATATLTSVESEGDIYKVEIDLVGINATQTQNATLYITKDGNLLFPSAIDLSSYTPQTTTFASSTTSTSSSFKAAADPIIGNVDAQVKIVEYADFECPYCGAVYPTITKILAEYPDQVQLVFQNFPIDKHTHAEKAAEAGECANIQGKFEAYYNTLYQNQDALEVADLKKYAADLGLDTASFNDCLDSGAMAQEVALDKSDGVTLGVSGTPTFFITGPSGAPETVLGNQPITAFEAVINADLNQTTAS